MNAVAGCGDQITMSTTPNHKAPVLLIHGMWSTPEALTDLCHAFAEQGYQVQAPCLPCHFNKQDYDRITRERLARTTLQDYVDFLIRQVKALPAAPIIVGHSMGGLLAQLVAARVPCERLILLSSAAPGGINGWSWSVVRTLGRNLFRFPLWKRVTELNASNVRYGIANAQTAETQRWIIDMATYESGMATFQIGIGGFLPKGFSRVDFSSVRCPVLVIGGTEDRITPIKVQRHIARRYASRSRLLELPGACHWTVGGSHFPQVRSAIFDWLADVTPRYPHAKAEACPG